MRIKAVIEKGNDGKFSVYTYGKIGNSFPGGFGDTVEDAKADFELSVRDAQNDYVKDFGKMGKGYQEINITYV